MPQRDDHSSDEQQQLEGDLGIAADTEKKLKKPKLYRVLLHNDDYTTMEFVVMVLKTVFHHRHEVAIQIMLNVHRQGIGVAGVYSYEVAETKVNKVLTMARKEEFPLRCSMEPA